MRGLSVNILITKGYPDTSNKGISATNSEDLVLMDVPRGNYTMERVKENGYVPVKIFEKRFGGKTYYHAAECDENGNKVVKDGMIGPMFGGTYIKTSDSRFPFDYPIPLHDRFETPEMYETLST